MSVNQIIEGTWKNILNLDEALYNKRIAICHECKIINKGTIFGDVCSSSLYLNPITNEVSEVEKKGFIQGCGCVLSSKTRVKDAHCPAWKW